ncbi:Glutaredoxin, partial [Streptococcus thermophilus CNCM I-1630]
RSNDKKFWKRKVLIRRKFIDEQPEKIDYVKSLGFTAAPVIEAGDIVFSGFQPG